VVCGRGRSLAQVDHPDDPIGPPGPDASDDPSDLSRADPSGEADQIDGEHQATDLAVGVDPSRRTYRQVTGCSASVRVFDAAPSSRRRWVGAVACCRTGDQRPPSGSADRLAAGSGWLTGLVDRVTPGSSRVPLLATSQRSASEQQTGPWRGWPRWASVEFTGISTLSACSAGPSAGESVEADAGSPPEGPPPVSREAR
jgi:hypothetical protein